MIDKLIEGIKKKNAPIVVGLDPMLKYVPEYIITEKFNNFGKGIKGACENGQLYFERLAGNIGHLNNESTKQFVKLDPHDIYINYNIGRFMEVVSNEISKDEAPSTHEICEITMDRGPCDWDKNIKLQISEVVYER